MPRPQFTLRALLVAMLVVAVSSRWLALWQRAIMARKLFEEASNRASTAWLAYDAHEVQRLRGALSNAVDAESRLPFVRDRTVQLWHLYRLRRADRICPVAFAGPVDQRALDEIRELRQELTDVAKSLGVRRWE